MALDISSGIVPPPYVFPKRASRGHCRCLHDRRSLRRHSSFCPAVGIIPPVQNIVHILIYVWSISLCSRRVAKLQGREATGVCLMNKRLEGWVCLGGDRDPSVKLLEGEDAQLLQQAYRVVDNFCRGIRILFQDLDFLALFDPVK